jgi:hypothetical protein
MNWTQISTSTTGIKEFHLTQDEQVLGVIKFNEEQQSVRIALTEEHHMYYMESSGHNSGRVALNNAYGIEVGRFTYNNRHYTGTVEINEVALEYRVTGNAPQIVLTKPAQDEPVAVCELPAATLGEDAYEQACLVVTLFCYAAVQAPGNAQEG